MPITIEEDVRQRAYEEARAHQAELQAVRDRCLSEIDEQRKQHEIEKEQMLDRHDETIRSMENRITKMFIMLAIGVVMSYVTILGGLGHDVGTIVTTAFTVGGTLIAALSGQLIKNNPHIKSFWANMVANLPEVERDGD